ncbi:hypothetical protein GJU94_13905 [Brucella sp. 10RB9214]|uniref:hypothetical protein n=1 Tax=unclassified Brucella TaxID=2632610 RepID=UPI0012AD65B9|nr:MULTISPECIES: hypothetical protein [unclassified Brucella]MRN45450.1 hypothetical protein [Brucella sp. 10RB9212]MRN50909.1 hypothetical protein [Brucella sp. 10RB9214]
MNTTAAPVTTPVNPADLSAVIRHAFIAGRGRTEGMRLSPDDIDAWVDYDPSGNPAYQRIITALFGW